MAPQPIPPPPAPVAPPPEPAPAPEPEAAPEPEPEPEAAPEEEPDAAEDEAAEEEKSSPAPSEEEGEPLSQDEMDAMFGDSSDEPEAIEPLAHVDGEDDEDAPPLDPDELPDPVPIPDALLAPAFDDDEDEPEPRSRLTKILALVAVILVVFGGIGAGLYFARGTIISFLPTAAGIYDMIGLSSEELGEGLAIRGVKSTREKKKGVEVLVIRGIIVNGIEKPKSVPMIRVSLYDADDNEIQFVVVAPSEKDIDPGKRSSFEARLKQPSALARRVEVTFTKDMAEG
jgi:hypothetical protein